MGEFRSSGDIGNFMELFLLPAHMARTLVKVEKMPSNPPCGEWGGNLRESRFTGSLWATRRSCNLVTAHPRER
jgi:hypothetical protein